MPFRPALPDPGSRETADEVEAGHQRMLQTLALIREDLDKHPFFSTEVADAVEADLRNLPASAPAAQRFQLLYLSGRVELLLGRTEKAIARMEEALSLLRKRDQQMRAQVSFELAVAYLRLAESENCCARAAPEACILPLRDGALHTEERGSRKAIEHLTTIISMSRDDDPTHLTARWLLNLASMTLGIYPKGVPGSLRIPPKRFRSTVDFPQFQNVSTALGVDTESLAGGAVVDDFDGDGNLDILTSSWDVAAPLHLFRNQGDGTFADVSEEAGLERLYGGLNLVQADYDNDGDVDVLVLRGAWLGAAGRHPNSLLRNDGTGHFVDVTFDAGLGDEHFPTQTASWADYDGDGDLDLYVGNETSDDLPAPCQLFRNEGDGTFTDVATDAGVAYLGFPKAVVWGDYDDDGWPDLFVSEYSGPNRLYRNQKDGTFEDVTEVAGVAQPLKSFPAWFWDYDNDGVLDLFVASYAGRVAEVARHYAGLPREVPTSHVYRGNGKGGFDEVGEKLGLDCPMLPMGANYGDLDGDGRLDFYLGTGDPEYESLMPNLMYWNRGAAGFVDVTMASGLGHLQKGHGVAFADLDNDGDLDLFEEMGGAYRGDEFRDALYENPGFGHRWITVECRGVRSNRSAIGARIHVRVVEDGEERSIYRHVSSGGSFGASPLRQTIGLGQAERIVSLEVRWPHEHATQVFEDVALDQSVRVTEGEDELETVDLQPIELATGS